MDGVSLIQDAVELCTSSIKKSAQWFTEILDSMGAGEFYIAMVFIVFACGFLLSNFGSIRSAGSDLASEAGSSVRRYAHKPIIYSRRGSKQFDSRPGHRR